MALLKIALVFRGPIRPNAEIVTENINLLKDSLSKLDNVKFDTFLISWDNENYGQELKKIINSSIIDNVCYFKDVDVEYIKSQVFTARQATFLAGQGNLKSPENSFRMFWSMKIISDVIKNHFNNYDFVFFSRTDTHFEVTDWSEWLDKNCYCLTDTVGPSHTKEWFWDQQGCASPEVMQEVWDYNNFELLNRAYTFTGEKPYNGNDFHFRNYTPESAILSLLELKKSTIKLKGCTAYQNLQMHPQRHDKETLNS